MRFLRNPLRVLAVLALATPFTLIDAPSASATTAGEFEFVGEASIGGNGLCSPVTLTSAGAPNPQACGGRTQSFSFSSTVCLGGSAGTKKDPAAGACTFQGSGSVSGNCGLSTGSVSGTADLAGQAYTFDASWTVGVGGTLALTGTMTKTDTGQTGPLVVGVQAAPNPLTPGTCSDDVNSEDSFIFSGSGTAALV